MNNTQKRQAAELDRKSTAARKEYDQGRMSYEELVAILDNEIDLTCGTGPLVVGLLAVAQ